MNLVGTYFRHVIPGKEADPRVFLIASQEGVQFRITWPNPGGFSVTGSSGSSLWRCTSVEINIKQGYWVPVKPNELPFLILAGRALPMEI